MRQTTDGRTALSLAVREKHDDIIDLLNHHRAPAIFYFTT
jgi:ankyrin repeat protein